MVLKPIAVPPKTAFELIGVGVTKGYELIAAKDLDAFKIGTATRITVSSIEAFIERQLAATKAA